MSSDEILAAKAAFDSRGMTSHELGSWPAFRDGYAAGLAAHTSGTATAYVARKFRCRMEHDLSIGASNGGDHDEFAAIFTNAEARAFIAEYEAVCLPAPAVSRLLAAAKLYRAVAKGEGPPSAAAFAMADGVIAEHEAGREPAPGETRLLAAAKFFASWCPMFAESYGPEAGVHRDAIAEFEDARMTAPDRGTIDDLAQFNGLARKLAEARDEVDRLRDAGARLLADLAEAGFRGAIVDRFAAAVQGGT